MTSLKEKTALITGAARGIGRAIALSLARDGASIALTDLLEEEGKKSAEEMAALGVKAVFYKCDVGDSEQVKNTVAAVKEEFGGIDILVNNAGITRDTLLLRMKEEDWDLVIKINLKGAYLFTRECISMMRKKRSGSIINISSVVGLMGNAGQANYCASKAGLLGLTKSVAREYASAGVRCNAVAPGFIESDMTKTIPEEYQEKIMDQIPMGKMGLPEDIANAVRFLAGDESSYITGQVLSVNGGMYT